MVDEAKALVLRYVATDNEIAQELRKIITACFINELRQEKILNSLYINSIL